MDADLTAYFAKGEEKLGLIPNVLRAFMEMYNDLMLAPSGLSKMEREMIAVAVSAENRCVYCLTAHGAALPQLSGDPALAEVVAQNWRAAPLNARQKAMLGFAVKLTNHPKGMEEPDRQALRTIALSDPDIWDISAVTAFYNMSNRLAAATKMQPNAEYHAAAR